MIISGRWLGMTVLLCLTLNAFCQAPRAVILTENLPGADPVLANELGEIAKGAGYSVESIDAAGLAAGFSSNKPALLLLPCARFLPADAVVSVTQYLQSGGNMVALGLPAWESAVYQINGKWVTQSDYDAAVASQNPAHVLVDFKNEDLKKWQRNSNNHQSKSNTELVSDGNEKALHVKIDELIDWEVIESPLLS